ncbi:MAG: zinc-ribbon domain-containing protein [Asgard group archaeon]|nr:zinc-ribbon domain-containing protein [Asgard group archaeon]
MSDVSYNYQFNLPKIRTVCLPKRVCFTTLSFAPLLGFILNIIALPGHVILFPYYLVVILSKGRPPKFLYYFIYFVSAFIYGAIHEKNEIWKDFTSLYYIYVGFIVGFVNWILTTVSLALIFPIFIYIEDWKLLTNVIYRITFGNWKIIVNECPEMRYKKSMEAREEAEKKEKRKKTMTQATKDGKYYDVKVEDATGKVKGTIICPTCGEQLEKDSTFCPKCGSYVK